MNSDKNDKRDKTKPGNDNPGVFTPEPPQVMNPSVPPKKGGEDNKGSKESKKDQGKKKKEN